MMLRFAMALYPLGEASDMHTRFLCGSGDFHDRMQLKQWRQDSLDLG
jgi:hypothetical protein